PRARRRGGARGGPPPAPRPGGGGPRPAGPASPSPGAPRAAADGLATLARRPDGLVLLRTFSKITGLAGLRVGYAIADPAVIQMLDRTREPFNVGRLSQVGAVAAVGDTAHPEATRRPGGAGKP